MDIDPYRARRLFQAVVSNALVDAVAPDRKYSLKPPKRKKGEADDAYELRTALRLEFRRASANADRTSARRWLTGNGEDFRMIATLAGYEPDAIRERSLKLERAGWPSPKREAVEEYRKAA